MTKKQKTNALKKIKETMKTIDAMQQQLKEIRKALVIIKPTVTSRKALSLNSPTVILRDR